MTAAAAPSVYLDHNATTPVAEEVVEIMARAQRDLWGNPGSIHGTGAAARYALEKARRSILKMLHAPSDAQLIFTSGATEAANLAIRGAALRDRMVGTTSHIVCSGAEHKAVLETVQSLGAPATAEVCYVQVDEQGRPAPVEIMKVVTVGTSLACFMLANNEVGSISDVAGIGRLVKGMAPGALVFCDATQAIGKISVNLADLGADLVSFSAHKLYGPKGIGALYLAPGVSLPAQLTGGPQESGLRAGTENVPAALGFELALRRELEDMASESARLTALRESFWAAISAALPAVRRNSPSQECLPNTLHVSIPDLDSRALVMELDRLGFACSSGSACTSSGHELSHVLGAMGLGKSEAVGALRVSLGRDSRDEHAHAFAVALVRACETLASAPA